MLIETLEDNKSYLKATLIQCLEEAKASHPGIVTSYKTILKREKKSIPEYMGVRRDPATGYRFYTGLQIRKIILYERQKAVTIITKGTHAKAKGLHSK